MRYLIQLVIPALIVIGVIYLASHGRREEESSPRSDKAMFAFILVVGALITIAVIFATQGYWPGSE